MTRELLGDLARRASATRSELAETAKLAWYFDHNVTKGGFAQLMHTTRIDRLEAVEHMLEAVAAPVAASFYRRAIECCLQDLESYHRFLAAGLAADSQVKAALHEVSLDYYGTGVEFPDEIIRWLAMANVRL